MIDIIKRLFRHKHKFYSIKWNREKYGPPIGEITEYSFQSRWLVRCNCGHEEVKEQWARL